MIQAVVSRDSLVSQGTLRSSDMNYKIERKNGEHTCFEFNEEADESLNAIVRNLERLQIARLTIEKMYQGCSKAWKNLAEFKDVRGSWFSSDFNSDAAANDIADKIRYDGAFEVRIMTYRDDGRAARGLCQGGLFLAIRVLKP